MKRLRKISRASKNKQAAKPSAPQKKNNASAKNDPTRYDATRPPRAEPEPEYDVLPPAAVTETRGDGAPTLADSCYYFVPDKLRADHKRAAEKATELEAVLEGLQIVLVVDRSGSMCSADEDPVFDERVHKKRVCGKPFWTRFDNVYQAVAYLSETIFEIDDDGEVPIIFFAEGVEEKVARNANQLKRAFKGARPKTGTTNMLAALRHAFLSHVAVGVKTLFIVFTDGAPNEGQAPKIKKLIREHLTKKDPSGDRLNVLFLRVGDDEDAKRFLQEMDDCEMIGDNVDTKSDNAMWEMGPSLLLLNAIKEHVDDTFQRM